MSLKEEFSRDKSWGLSVAIDLKGCDPGIIRNADLIRQFVYELCDLIGAKRFGECTIVHFGKRPEIAGFSMTQLIESSLISGHFVNSTNNVYLDVFSCAYYDPEVVADKSKSFFKAESCETNILIRK